MSINENIKQKRCEIGLSQYELAIRVKSLNQSQISKIEQGIRTVTAEDLISIAKALDVSVSELIS
jgi:transcriptional regulator with XRE-family HTH domain